MEEDNIIQQKILSDLTKHAPFLFTLTTNDILLNNIINYPCIDSKKRTTRFAREKKRFA